MVYCNWGKFHAAIGIYKLAIVQQLSTMVVLNIKRGNESQFLLETTVQAPVEEVLNRTVMIHNGRLKVYRICTEMELLAEHGPSLPPEMQGLTEDQIKDLQLEDNWAKICIASGGVKENKDVCGRRNGCQPLEKMQEVLLKTVAEAKAIVSKEQVKSSVCLTEQHICDALDILRGAIMIVYPMNLPPHDPIRKELENREVLSGTQDEKLVIMKIQKRGQGPPGREPMLTEEQQKALMAAEFKRREELKRLDNDDDDSYLNSAWADNHQLHRRFQGLDNISWKPH
ncbi:cilia- and flagella-associated protein 298 isoform X3 [Cherax quadricarinatus]|uniref:cilia- and flagella-associated protein 298 isoform X3 n=1 Tax=Cherax quadricarinatus TaxID=27406 RepID=UPI00387EACFC